MLSAFVNAFKVPDLRKKLLFTLFVIALYRLGSHIPVPGIDIKAARSLTSVNGGVLGLLNLFSAERSRSSRSSLSGSCPTSPPASSCSCWRS